MGASDARMAQDATSSLKLLPPTLHLLTEGLSTPLESTRWVIRSAGTSCRNEDIQQPLCTPTVLLGRADCRGRELLPSWPEQTLGNASQDTPHCKWSASSGCHHRTSSWCLPSHWTRLTDLTGPSLSTESKPSFAPSVEWLGITCSGYMTCAGRVLQNELHPCLW